MQRQTAVTEAGDRAPEDGEIEELFPTWGRVAGFVGVLVSVFVMALVVGRLTGPEAPGEVGQSTSDLRPVDTAGTPSPENRHGHGR